MEHIFNQHQKRKTASLNGEWDFCLDKENIGKEREWYKNFPKEAEYINVPGCWNNELGLFLYIGKAWYKKEFEVQKDCYLQLTFGAVSGQADVYLDGEYLGEHYGGWLEFSVGKFVKAGKHTVIVCVDDTPNEHDTFPLKKVDWRHFGGITRSVEFCEFEAPFIKNTKITYTLSDDLTSAVINAKIYVENPFGTEYKTNLSFYIDGKFLKTETICVSESGMYEIGGICLNDIKLWDLDDGNLYDVKVVLGGDDICEKIGFRKVEVKNTAVYINGKKVFLKGANRHELHPDHGFAVPANISKRDVDILKDMNSNFVRMSHYPQTHNFIDYLDREGLCSWLEIPMWQFYEESLADEFVLERAKKLYTEMVDQYYNHPSIIIWGLHNEVQTDTKAGYEFTKSAYEYVKSMDNSRLISFASDRFLRDISLEFADIVALNNYFGWYYGEYSDWEGYIKGFRDVLKAQGLGDKPVMMSEFGVPAIYGQSSFEKERWSMEHQSDYVKGVIELCAKEEGVCGTAVWVLFDFPSQNDLNKARGFNNKGLLNEYRKPKLAYYTVKNLYKDIK